MENKPPRPMTPFDELTTSPQLQMLKLFLPYTPASNQQFLGVFIKFLELQETLSFFHNKRESLQQQAFHGENSSPLKILEELKPYMPRQEAEMMDTFLNMMNIMEMVQMFQAEMPKQDNDNEPSSSEGGFNPMEMMMGMLTPEQQGMFEMYNSMFAGETGTAKDSGPKKEAETAEQEYTPEDLSAETPAGKKGDDINERVDEQSGNEEH